MFPSRNLLPFGTPADAGDSCRCWKLSDHGDRVLDVQHHHTAVRQTDGQAGRVHRTPLQILNQRVWRSRRSEGAEGTLLLSVLVEEAAHVVKVHDELRSVSRSTHTQTELITAQRNMMETHVHICCHCARTLHGVIRVSLCASGCDHVSGPEQLQRSLSAGDGQAVPVGDAEQTAALLRQIRTRLKHTDLLHLTELEVLHLSLRNGVRIVGHLCEDSRQHRQHQ